MSYRRLLTTYHGLVCLFRHWQLGNRMAVLANQMDDMALTSHEEQKRPLLLSRIFNGWMDRELDLAVHSQ